MSVYYKATRPDGRDFYTGTVDYAAALASGEPLPELRGGAAFPGGGWYHLATVPTECVGMSWPCRLFEVEPVGDMMMDNAHPHKIGCRSVRVLREIEAHRVFGPQGEQVVTLIERCLTLSAAEVDRLAAAWGAAWDTWAVAWDTWAVARGATWDAAWDTWAVARGATWDTTWGAARGAMSGAARGATWDTTWGATWDTTWGAARGAAVALLCRDLIGQAPGWDQDAYNLLTGPWRDVIGPIHPDDGDGDERAVREALRGESDV